MNRESSQNQRRRRSNRNEIAPAHRRALHKTATDLNTVIDPLERTIDEINSIGQSRFHYSGRPDGYLRFLVAAKAHHEAIRVGEEIEGPSDIMKEGKKGDVYATVIRGVSLPDIEQFPLPLDLSSIRKISQYIRHGFLSRLSETQLGMQRGVLMLPTQTFARGDFENESDNRRMPKTLDALTQRMIQFMDFFTPFLMDPNVNSHERDQVMNTFPWVGRFLVGALGDYVPARFGITPSSAMKSFEVMVNDYPSFLRKKYFETLRIDSAGAFRADILPEELHAYTQYDPAMDRKAAERLEMLVYRTQRDFPPVDLDEVIADFKRSEKNVHRDIVADRRQKSVEVALGNLNLDVIITTQYRRSVTFILKFRDEPVHITVEIGEDAQIYGLPQEMVSRFPIIGEHLTRDLLHAVTVESKKRYPDPATRVRDVPAVTNPPEQVISTLPESMLLPVGVEDDAPPIKRKRKRETLQSYVTPLRSTQPELPEAQPKRVRIYRIAYSKTKIRELAGKKISDEMVDRLAAALRQVEYGEKRVKALENDGHFTSKDLEVRVGDFRMVVENIGRGRLNLTEVFDRRDAFR